MKEFIAKLPAPQQLTNTSDYIASVKNTDDDQSKALKSIGTKVTQMAMTQWAMAQLGTLDDSSVASDGSSTIGCMLRVTGA